MLLFDSGPPKKFFDHFQNHPDYTPVKQHFWFDWGPIFYRGRLDGSAKVLCVASDPGPTERVVGRTLVGDAGQRVQGFLSKLGLTKSYVCVNVFVYALLPSSGDQGLAIMSNPDQTSWRNKLFGMLKTPKLKAIVAFGEQAQNAVGLWPGKGAIPVVEIPHPSSRDEARLLTEWKAAVTRLRGIITPDRGGDATVPNYGTKFDERDYARIPVADLPFGLPSWMGDDAWGRKAHPHHANSVRRPPSDDRHTLIWIAPET